MPAYTVNQINQMFGPGGYNYVAADGDLNLSLQQILPRLYNMGLWRDLTYEVSLSGARGYVSLPLDTECVLASTINDLPRPVRSLWHDVKISGRNAVLSSYYGIVDDGYSPLLVDLADVQDAAYGSLSLVPSGSNNVVWSAGPNGEITFVTDDVDAGGSQTITPTWDSGSGEWELLGDTGHTFSTIHSITYENVAAPVDLIDPANDNVVITTIPVGSGVVRYRRFRTSLKDTATTVHLLIKRGCPSDLSGDTIIYLGNIGAIKYGLRGLIAEDDGDLDRSEIYWKKAGELLDQELLSVMGAAKPTLTIDLSGGGSARSIHSIQ